MDVGDKRVILSLDRKEALAMTENGLYSMIIASLKTQTATWAGVLLFGILSVFSTRIAESVKLALNRADLRTNQFEELASNVSQYIFIAELNTEFIEHDWTTKQTMTELVKEYNDSITALRKKEFVYLSWIQKYWGKNEAAQFESFMKSVLEFDLAIHSINDELEAVNIIGSKPKIDRKRAEEALKVMKPAIENMRNQGRQFLMKAI